MNKFVLLTPFLFFFAAGHSQTILDKISLGVGPSIISPTSKNPAALGLSFQPTFHIAYNFSISARYEMGLSAIGQNQRYTPRFFGSNNPEEYYTQNEISSKWQRSLALLLNYSPTLFKTKFNFGVGVSYFWRPATFLRKYNIHNDDLIDVVERPSINKFGSTMSFGIESRNIRFGIVFNRSYKNQDFFPAMENHSSMYIHYVFNKVEIKPWFQQKKMEAMPFFLIEVGIQHAGFTKKHASTRRVFIEPKFVYSLKHSLSFRFSTGFASNKGYNDSPNWVINKFPISASEVTWDNKDKISDINSKIIFFDTYKKIENDWLFYSIGAGVYSRKKYEEITGYDFDRKKKTITGEPKQQNFGIATRIGLKSGIARVSLEFNYTGKNIPNYFGVQLGVETGWGDR